MQGVHELRTFLLEHASHIAFRGYVWHCFPDDGRSRHKINWSLLLATREFAGRKRRNGEDYVVHCMCVALLMMHFGVRDADAIAAALLHDLVEDIPGWSIHRLVFATKMLKVAYLVWWVTKSGGGLRPRHWRMHWFYWLLRRFAPELAKLIKIFDRIHNLMTSDVLPPKKRLRIVSESVIYYQPVAERLSAEYQSAAELLNVVIHTTALEHHTNKI